MSASGITIDHLVKYLNDTYVGESYYYESVQSISTYLEIQISTYLEIQEFKQTAGVIEFKCLQITTDQNGDNYSEVINNISLLTHFVDDDVLEFINFMSSKLPITNINAFLYSRLLESLIHRSFDIPCQKFVLQIYNLTDFLNSLRTNGVTLYNRFLNNNKIFNNLLYAVILIQGGSVVTPTSIAINFNNTVPTIGRVPRHYYIDNNDDLNRIKFDDYELTYDQLDSIGNQIVSASVTGIVHSRVISLINQTSFPYKDSKCSEIFISLFKAPHLVEKILNNHATAYVILNNVDILERIFSNKEAAMVVFTDKDVAETVLNTTIALNFILNYDRSRLIKKLMKNIEGLQLWLESRGIVVPDMQQSKFKVDTTTRGRSRAKSRPRSRDMSMSRSMSRSRSRDRESSSADKNDKDRGTSAERIRPPRSNNNIFNLRRWGVKGGTKNKPRIKFNKTAKRTRGLNVQKSTIRPPLAPKAQRSPKELGSYVRE
jgi:hypothetical protein